MCSVRVSFNETRMWLWSLNVCSGSRPIGSAWRTRANSHFAHVLEIWQRVTWMLNQQHFKTIAHIRAQHTDATNANQAHTKKSYTENAPMPTQFSNEFFGGFRFGFAARIWLWFICRHDVCGTNFPTADGEMVALLVRFQLRQIEASIFAVIASRRDCNQMLAISRLTYHFKSCDLRCVLALCLAILSDLFAP